MRVLKDSPREAAGNEMTYSSSVTSQGDLNRMIAAHSYVSDVLVGDTVKENSHEKQVQKDWRDSLYQRVGVQLCV